NAKQKGVTIHPQDLAASFQASVIDVLVTKTVKAVKEYGVEQVLLAGGVAANKGLRAALQEAFEEVEVELIIPPLFLCTDNAAMIAAAGTILFERGKRGSMDM
ncbi:tRNA (adenosine(37)-N6)-threonylcarbamoyltransferase complex transferase subunit TsaD, partial [Bacillus thuringiensis]